jgi:hypothetical protein
VARGGGARVVDRSEGGLSSPLEALLDNERRRPFGPPLRSHGSVRAPPLAPWRV